METCDAHHVYEDDQGGSLVGEIYGSDSSGRYGNEILGDGDASYIEVGDGDNMALLGNFYAHVTDPLGGTVSSVIEGGNGHQALVGMGNGAETLVGGAAGADTSAVTFIDGGGADALLVGGGQNSFLLAAWAPIPWWRVRVPARAHPISIPLPWRRRVCRSGATRTARGPTRTAMLMTSAPCPLWRRRWGHVRPSPRKRHSGMRRRYGSRPDARRTKAKSYLAIDGVSHGA